MHCTATALPLCRWLKLLLVPEWIEMFDAASSPSTAVLLG
jgi:hypothetical protein